MLWRAELIGDLGHHAHHVKMNNFSTIHVAWLRSDAGKHTSSAGLRRARAEACDERLQPHWRFREAATFVVRTAQLHRKCDGELVMSLALNVLTTNMWEVVLLSGYESLRHWSACTMLYSFTGCVASLGLECCVKTTTGRSVSGCGTSLRCKCFWDPGYVSSVWLSLCMFIREQSHSCTSSVPRAVSLLQRVTTTCGFRLKVLGHPWRSTSTDEVVLVMLNLMEDMSREDSSGSLSFLSSSPYLSVSSPWVHRDRSLSDRRRDLLYGRRDRCQAVTCLLSFFAVSRQIPIGLMCFGLMVWLVNALKKGFSRQERRRHQDADVLIGQAIRPVHPHGPQSVEER